MTTLRGEWAEGLRLAFDLLLDASWRGAALLLLAALALRCWRGASAARRHLVWGVALSGLLLLPLFSLSLPRWKVTLPERLASAAALAAPLDFAAAPLPADRALAEPARPAVEAAAPARGVPWRESLFLLWLAGALSLLGVLLLALGRAVSLTRSARALPAGRCTAMARALSAAMGLRRAPVLLDAGESAMPMTWGVFRPVVLLPRDAEGWPEAKLSAVLVHELAHLRRRDVPVQLLSRVACAFFWYNPLAWTAFRALREESERACDDVVLETGIRPTAYADHLLDFARSARSARGLAFASSALTDGSPLRSRIHALLAERRDRRRVSLGVLVAALAAGTTLSVALAAATPTPAARVEDTTRPRAGEGPAPASRAPVSPLPEVVTSAAAAQAPPSDGLPAGAQAARALPDPTDPPGRTDAPDEEAPAIQLPREVGAAISASRAPLEPPPLVLRTATPTRAAALAPDSHAVRYTIVPRYLARSAGNSSSSPEGIPGCQYVRVTTVTFDQIRDAAALARENGADRIIEVRKVYPNWNSRDPRTGLLQVPHYRGVAVRYVEPSSRVDPKCR